MKHVLLLLSILLLGFNTHIHAQPDTVRVGIYITSIHDINFKDKEYSLNAWLWLKYKNPDFNFAQNLEIPQAKTFTKSFTTIDSSEGQYYILMKLECVMKDSWKINNFPFDRQVMRFSVENAQFDSESLIFVADIRGQNHGKFTVSGWTIDSFLVSTGIKTYETAFGDQDYEVPRTQYGVFKVKIGMVRDAWGLFWKMFLGMYVSFCIAITCLFIHADNIDSRLGLSVGSLFTAIGNKYVIDSALPESSSFTLVDTLHSLTLVFIFSVISISVYALKLRKEDKLKLANRLDKYSVWVLIGLYLLLNVFFISLSATGA
ncbi:MAG: hypothetical protein V4658_14945 [Bacteroidota bacterium]